MSHHTLERVFVRMLFDPAFVTSVYEDSSNALAGLAIEPAECANLLSVDRRAFGHDPLRRIRTLRILSEEFKAATTLVLSATRSLSSLDDFFSSSEFHDSVQQRGLMALAFGKYVERIIAELPIDLPQLPDVLRLESMLARCRREIAAARATNAASRTVDLNATLRLAPGHAAGRFNANVVEAINTAERYLFEVGLMPAVALCEDAPRLESMPEVADEYVFLVALPAVGGATLLPVDADYFAIIDQFSNGPLRLSTAIARLVDRGIDRADAISMAGSLVDECVLITE